MTDKIDIFKLTPTEMNKFLWARNRQMTGIAKVMMDMTKTDTELRIQDVIENLKRFKHFPRYSMRGFGMMQFKMWIFDICSRIKDKILNNTEEYYRQQDKQIDDDIIFLVTLKPSYPYTRQVKLLQDCYNILVKISYKMGKMDPSRVLGSKPNVGTIDNVEEMSKLESLLLTTEEELRRMGIEPVYELREIGK